MRANPDQATRPTPGDATCGVVPHLRLMLAGGKEPDADQLLELAARSLAADRVLQDFRDTDADWLARHPDVRVRERPISPLEAAVLGVSSGATVRAWMTGPDEVMSAYVFDNAG